MRRLSILTAMIGGLTATSAFAYAPADGEFRIVDTGPYAYLFERPSRAEAEVEMGPYGYLFRHQFPEHRLSASAHGDLHSDEPGALR